MKLITAIISALMLSSLALAAPEAHQLGPYNVSFNMNTGMNYQIQTPSPAMYPFATIYPLVIITDNTTGASISITKYNNLTDSTLQVSEEITALRMALRGINLTSSVETAIDGRNGFLLSGTPFRAANALSGLTFYQAQYWLDSSNCTCGSISAGTALVDITSTYPQDVTQGILGSIHITGGLMPQSSSGISGGQTPQNSMPSNLLPQNSIPPSSLPANY